MKLRTTLWLTVWLMGGLFASGCSTIPSCAWGKCASTQRYQSLVPQTGERVYPMKYGEAYEAVKDHLVKRGYPLEREDPVEGIIVTKPYSEEPFARFLGVQYSWKVGVRKMDTLNTQIQTRLYVHEKGKEPRLLTPGLDPEPYRYFWWKVEDALVHVTEKARG
ncbi:MAG: hypothetical protein ACREQA_11260 [Candidatus Binatia bacterium]